MQFFSDHYGVNTDVSNEQLRTVLRISMSGINQSLEHFKRVQRERGFEQLADVAANALGGINQNTLHYQQAVYSSAKAHLVREQIQLDRKPNAESQAKTSVALVSYYETQTSTALANLHGRGSIGVQLL